MARNEKNTRMCASCRTRADRSKLVRICRKKDGEFVVESTQERCEGRGMYLCPNIKCLEGAIKRKSFSRNLRCEIPDSLTEKIESFVKSINAE